MVAGSHTDGGLKVTVVADARSGRKDNAITPVNNKIFFIDIGTVPNFAKDPETLLENRGNAKTTFMDAAP